MLPMPRPLATPILCENTGLPARHGSALQLGASAVPAARWLPRRPCSAASSLALSLAGAAVLSTAVCRCSRSRASRAAALSRRLRLSLRRKLSQGSHDSRGCRRGVALRGGASEAAWHSGRSGAEEVDEAVEEVLLQWRASAGREAMGDLPVDWSKPPCLPPFEHVASFWHAWRADAYGPVSLAGALVAALKPELRPAFELYPEEADLYYPEWRTSLRWERPGGSLPDRLWKAAKRKGAVAAEWRRVARTLRAEREIDPGSVGRIQAGFALIFVPVRWASQLQEIARRIEGAINWVDAPLVAVLSEGCVLSLGTASMPACTHPPTAFFLGDSELEEAGAEGYRLQEQLKDNLAQDYYSEYYQKHGRTNGTVVAARQILQRGPDEAGSAIIFSDPAGPADFPRRALGLLDACFPDAVKAGLVAAASDNAPGSSLYVGGRFGGIRSGGLVVLLLPGKADTAMSLCGCEPIGPRWEVFDADASAGASVIRSISDPDSLERDLDGRRLAFPAGKALLGATREADASSEANAGSGVNVWIGVPRVPMRLAHERAPGIGEWSLFRGSAVTAEGSLLLEGPGPGAEGVGSSATLGGRSINRIQGFQSVVDHASLGRLQTGYEMERLVERGAGEAQERGWRPYATLVFGGGEGPLASITDETLHGGVCLGAAVLGAPGYSMSEVPAEDAVRDWGWDGPPPQRSTLIHRQAAALVMLYD